MFMQNTNKSHGSSLPWILEVDPGLGETTKAKGEI
jgi:hypothetical protein